MSMATPENLPRSIAATGLVWVLLASSVGGCATFETRGDRSYQGARTYSGARTSLDRIGQGLLNWNVPLVVIGFVDLPFSFLADTVLLPVTISEESSRQTRVAERLQTRSEIATGIRSQAGVAPTETARRLFEACVSRLESLDPSLTDCYSIEARIALLDPAHPTGGELSELSGAEYKARMRQVLARIRARGDYFTYREISYAPEGANVRVHAQRVSSSSPTRAPVTFLLGPGADGEWRILAERGPDWE